jgi:hypothetical protein
LQGLYKKTEQRNGGISFYDMVNILKGNIWSIFLATGASISDDRKDKINKEIANK